MQTEVENHQVLKQSQLLAKEYGKLRSIESCLLLLDIPGKLISRSHHKVGYVKPLKHDQYRGSRKGSRLYDRYTDSEIMEMAKEHYRLAVKRYHPDIHKRKKKFYEERMKQINFAFTRIKIILNNKNPYEATGFYQ